MALPYSNVLHTSLVSVQNFSLMVTTYNSTALKAYKPPLARQAANYLHQYPILSRNYLKTCVDQTAIQSYSQRKKIPTQPLCNRSYEKLYTTSFFSVWWKIKLTHEHTTYWTMLFLCITHTFRETTKTRTLTHFFSILLLADLFRVVTV